jgi:trans-aconitate methyltransferase
MNGWINVWNNEDRINKIILECLIKADGFDGGAGAFEVNEWLEYTKYLYNKIGLKTDDSVFDVGCGSSAFLYPHYLESSNSEGGGIDYSKILIGMAKMMIPEYDFRFCDAIDLDSREKFDIVLSHSVFQYFESLEYASDVIDKMLAKADQSIAILDVNDHSKEKLYHQTRIGQMSLSEYEGKYKDLNHLFYKKEWFIEIAEMRNLKIDIFDQNFSSYGNSKLRYNVLIKK